MTEKMKLFTNGVSSSSAISCWWGEKFDQNCPTSSTRIHSNCLCTKRRKLIPNNALSNSVCMKRHRNVFPTFRLCSMAPGRTFGVFLVIVVCALSYVPGVRGEEEGVGAAPAAHVTNSGGYVEIPCCSHQFRRKGTGDCSYS